MTADETFPALSSETTHAVGPTHSQSSDEVFPSTDTAPLHSISRFETCQTPFETQHSQ